jgi:hypothetical protein
MKIGDKVGEFNADEIEKAKRIKRGRVPLYRLSEKKKKRRRKFPKSKSVHAVSGGLPSLGKRHS